MNKRLFKKSESCRCTYALNTSEVKNGFDVFSTNKYLHPLVKGHKIYTAFKIGKGTDQRDTRMTSRHYYQL